MGLKYASSDSENLMNAMAINLGTAAEAMESLIAGSRQLTEAVDGRTLSGAAYRAGKGLFEELVIPTIERVQKALEKMQSELSTYRSADGIVAGEGYLDEDALKEQIEIKRNLIECAEDMADQFCRIAETTMEAATAEMYYECADEYEHMADSLQDDINGLQDRLGKLHEFSDRVRGLFRDSMEDLDIAMQGIKVLGDTTVSKDGTYMLPIGVDKTWFTEKKNKKQLKEYAYDLVLEELLTFDEKGTIIDVNFDKLIAWQKLFLKGKLNSTQIQAVKTAMLTIPGFLDKKIGKEKEINKFLQKMALFQDAIGGGWSIFGFAYNMKDQHFYTKQDSAQSHCGFGDLFDEMGPALGMDLDTATIQFWYEGKEYRFQVWKGTYGGGTMVGGEQGWYVYDPEDRLQHTEEAAAAALGQDDWVPAAAPEDRIHMVNTLCNRATGMALTEPSDTDDFASGGAYWNLDTTALKPGFVKSNVYAEGQLDIEDEGLRNMVYNQLKTNDEFSDVAICGNEVTYTWGE